MQALKTFIRSAVASARVRAADDAAQVRELEAQLLQLQIGIDAARARAAASALSLDVIQAQAELVEDGQQ